MNTHVVKPVQHGDQIELEITSLAFGGDSVGRYQDFAIFVPGGLPGERVRLRITQVKDHYASGEILEILRQSPDRVTPPCAIFEECGGCQWQHFNYPRQLQTKRQFIVDAFQRIGKLPPVAVQPCLPSPDPYGYRNKAMPVISMREGHFISGIYEPRSHKLVPYHNCPIQGDAINDLIQKVLKKVDRSGLTPYQEKKHSGFLRHLAVRQGVKTGEILLAFVTRTPIPEERLQKPTVLAEELDQILPRIARELIEEVPGLVGVLQNINSSRTNIVFGPTTVLLGGRDHYFEVIDELRLKVSLKSFLQVNTRQADTLHTVVREALGDPTSKKKWGTVLDLYSGIGTLSLAVADKADYVVGVEEVAPSVEDAKVNAEINQKVNIDFLEGDVDKILVGLKDKGLNLVDAVLLDPPRKGVLPEVLSRVTAFRPERLVYVSCDPSTLARDLALLTKQGYQVDWAQPLDMFPQTYHVETVVRLTRVEPLPPEVLPENQAALEPFRLPKEAPPLSMNVLARTRPAWERLSESLGAFARAARLALGLAVLIVAAPFKGAWRVLGALTFAVSSLRQRLKRKPTEPKRLEEVSPVASTEIPEAPVPLIATETEEESVRAVIAAPIDRLAVPEPVPEPEAPEDKATAPPRRPRFHLPPLRWEAPWVESFWNRTLAWGREHRTLRWAMAALFLLGGGFIAKATLSPEAKKTSMLVPTVSQMIPDVIAVMPSRNFLRYEMVPFEVRVNSAELPYFNQMRATVEVYQGGNAINMVDGRSKLSLKKDTSNGRFIGNWPIPYNPVPGTYIAEVVVSSPEWGTPKTFESAFTISPLKPTGLFPGYAALTMEGGKQLIKGALPALDGSDSIKPENAIGWCKFMGANLYCYLMGQTSIWDHFNPKDFPFNHDDMETGRKYARYAHEGGLKFAAYLTTFKVVGDAWNQAPYEFSLGYDPNTDEVIQTRFISLNDTKRHHDVVEFLKRLDQDPLVDMVGLDYVRTGFAGYEMVDEFVKDLAVPGPSNYWDMTPQERIHWLAKTVELKENPQVVSLFQWWRAHKVAVTLKGILDEAHVSKPVFTFTLGWQQGHQHGQDPAMFVDAGVNYNHIMLYEGDRNTVEWMKRQWPKYLSRQNGMYAMGEMVDFNWAQRSIDPPAPEEVYDRQVEIFRSWFPVNAGLGMFWHDLYRIVYGLKGPYSSMEWAVAGGKAFTTLQHAEGLCPIEVTLSAPREIPAGVPVPISVTVRNQSPENLKGMVLHQIDTTRDYYTDLATVGPFDLPAGNMVKVKSLYMNIPREDHPDRDNRYMAAVMVEQAGQTLRAFDFAYLRKIAPGSQPHHWDDPRTGGDSTGDTPAYRPGSPADAGDL